MYDTPVFRLFHEPSPLVLPYSPLLPSSLLNSLITRHLHPHTLLPSPILPPPHPFPPLPPPHPALPSLRHFTSPRLPSPPLPPISLTSLSLCPPPSHLPFVFSPHLPPVPLPSSLLPSLPLPTLLPLVLYFNLNFDAELLLVCCMESEDADRFFLRRPDSEGSSSFS